MSEPCTCPVAKYCERHKRTKTRASHALCQTREDYRLLWDRMAARSRGLGDTVKKVLKATGIARVVEAVTGKPNCGGCKQRQEKLNELVPYKQE